MVEIKTQIFKEINGNLVLATSYSQIDTFLQCHYRWYKDYLLGEREPVTAEALALGSSVHKTLEQYMNYRKQGQEWTVAESLDRLTQNMEDENIPWLSEENKEKATLQHENMITGLASGQSNLAKFLADKEIVACEKEFVYPVQLPFDVVFNKKHYNKIYIIGSIDFIVKDKNGDLICIDYKSGKNTFKPKKLRENLQLPIYALVINWLYGRLPIEMRYYFTRLDKFQSVEQLAVDDSQAQVEYYKSGKKKGQVKHKQRTIDDIIKELLDIFYQQYSGKEKYTPSPTPLCSWCPHGMYEKNNCKYCQRYIRKDLPYPFAKTAHKRRYK